MSGTLQKRPPTAAKEAAEAAAEQAASDIAAKAFCRVAVPLLAPLEAIPIVGEIPDIAEIAATPALIQACVKGVEKEGRAKFKVFGKEHTLSVSHRDFLPRVHKRPQ